MASVLSLETWDSQKDWIHKDIFLICFLLIKSESLKLAFFNYCADWKVNEKKK